MSSRNLFKIQAEICQAIGHPLRLELLHGLRDSLKCVNDLAKATGLSQATVSRHLAILRNTGLVIAQRQGQAVIYRLANPKITAVCDLMGEVLAEQITRQSEIAKALDEQAP